MKRDTFTSSTEAAEWMSAAILVLGALMVSFILVFATTDAVHPGIERGDMAPDFTAMGHSAGASEGTWDSFTLHDEFDFNWSGNHTEGVFTVIEFLDTDCPFCWSSADKISSLDYQLKEMELGDDVRYIFIAVQLPIPGHSTSRTEIVAFQEKTSHPGCKGDTNDCSERPGLSHPGIYIDDRELDIFKEWGIPATPHYFILKPNGMVYWNGGSDSQDALGVKLGDALCEDGGRDILCEARS